VSQAGRELEQFRELLGRCMGLSFDEDKRGLLREVLGRRLARARLTPERYLEHAAMQRGELRELSKELTVTETYFFRHAHQLRAFSELLGRTTAGSLAPLRVLCAGCSSGEEPYSLAVLARAALFERAAERVSIVAVDLNPAMLEKARSRRYTPWSLRETSPETQARWFRATGSEFVLDPEIARMVRFEERNLAEPDPLFWLRGGFDVVFCRNVIMYFTPEAARAVVRRFAECLLPGGLLFLGHAESLRGLSHDFHLRHEHDTFFYERRKQLTHADSSDDNARLAPAPRETSWVDAIAHSTERVHSLTASAPSEAPKAPVTPWDPLRAAELIHAEQFAEARRCLDEAPPDREHDPDTMLLRAVLLTHDGDLAGAEELCAQLLELDEASPGAHYIKALCRESAGDRDGAVDADLVAVHADPSFAMPRLHLGFLARRAGDVEAARREFAEALSLFEREDSLRLLLFAGGFSRAALMGLCRAELAACGGAA
jgi:chemotaxis protein methyltransferase CheR